MIIEENAIYLSSLVVGGIALFLLLLRLFSSDWRSVVFSLLYATQPWWAARYHGEEGEQLLSRIKIACIAFAAIYLTVYFHWKLGDWWVGIIGGLV